MRNVQLLCKKVLDLISEVETYSFYRQNLKASLKKLFHEYQEGKHTYFTYENAKRKLLKGATEEQWDKYYDSYILALLKRVEAYNNQIFYETYQDRSYLKIGRVEPKPVLAPAPAPPKPAPKPEPEPEPEVKPKLKTEKVQVLASEIKKSEVVEKPVPVPEVVHEPLPGSAPVEEKKPEEMKLVEVKPSAIDKMSAFFRRAFARKAIDARMDELKKTSKPAAELPRKKEMKKPAPAAIPKPTVKPKTKLPKVKPKPSFLEFLFRKPRPMLKPLVYKEKEKKKPLPEKKPSEAVALQGFFGVRSTLRRIFGVKQQRVEFSDEGGKLGPSTLQLETLRRRTQPEISEEIEKITATALTKEASRIKSIMERRKALKIYQPSFFGSLANITIKRISLYLLDNFPDFFKDLYHALRLANIKVLSNTYVNMMVLGCISSFFIGLVVMGGFFASTALPFAQVVFRTIMMSLLIGLATFAGFYAFPYSKLKQRRRSINTNLPFAINHMSAVASSGVSPTKMFQLISQSKEYGEISTEIEKIVNYIEIFGYDILTALKSVAATTPSDAFKDFFEGMISTTQTGGDIKSYLAQKSEEAMVNYKLERQKYTETISTYSDIYTGILIAAPLFFVAALSLVSLLGGKIGGINVNVVIVLGTYVIIPILNVAFLSFLEMTQPEI